jgi:hypothetical protein
VGLSVPRFGRESAQPNSIAPEREAHALIADFEARIRRGEVGKVDCQCVMVRHYPLVQEANLSVETDIEYMKSQHVWRSRTEARTRPSIGIDRHFDRKAWTGLDNNRPLQLMHPNGRAL